MKSFKKAFSIFFSVIMIFTIWVFVAPEIAGSATAGDYRIFIGIQVTNGSGSEHEDNLYVKVTYDKKDGSGSAQTGDLLDHNACWGPDEWSNHYANIDTTIAGFPTRVDVCVDMKGVGFAYLDTDALTIYVQSIKVYNYNTNQWVTFWEGSVKFDSERNEYKAHWDRTGHHNDNRTSRDWETYEPYIDNWDTKPYADSITSISGNDSVNVSTTNSTVTKSYSLGTVKDQYGVNWREDASWDTATVSNGVTFSNGTLTVPASSNRANDYNVTLKEKCGSITKTKTVTIKTFDYKVTFYDENGTTVLKDTQTIDYGGSATAPSTPTKASDSNKHYTFSSWTGDGYTNITSGAQTKTVKASYTGAAHTPSGWQHDSSQHWKECTYCSYITTAKANHSYGSWSTNTATCTSGGSHYRDCSCGYRQTESTSSLGHNSDSSSTDSSHLKSAATCTAAAVYYKSCSRCGTNSSSTFTSGTSLGHSYGTPSYTWADDGLSCSAKRICSRDSSHKENENATVTSAVKTAATCTTMGTTRYTAAFSNSSFSSQTKDVQDIAINPNNHASYGQTFDSSTKQDPTYDIAGYTGDEKCDGCHAVRKAGESVPALKTLIDLDDAPAVTQGFSAGGVYTLRNTTKKSGIGYSLQGLATSVGNNAHPVAKSSNDITGYNVTSLTLSNASVTMLSGNRIKVTPTTMTFSQPITFYAVVAVTGTLSEKYDTDTVYSYEKITIKPTQVIYYEETEGGMIYTSAIDSNGYGEWKTDGTASQAEIALESAEEAGIGYSDDYASFATYSGGEAKKVSVSKAVGGEWPKVSFSFTGTGFDLISVTDSESGFFVATISQNGQQVARKVIDTYYGSTYTLLFYNLHTKRILPNNWKGVSYVVPLYFADESRLSEIPADEVVYDGIANQIVYTTNVAYAKSSEQAYGWALTGSDDALYQIPVISWTGHTYGTYDVVVEAMFVDAFGHYNTDGSGNKYYNLTVDGIRVYEPAKNNATAYADGGNLVEFTNIRNEVGNASSMLLLDGNVNVSGDSFNNYLKVAPKNEIYIGPGKTAAFEIDAAGCEDFRLGMKSANGKSCDVDIAFSGSNVTLNPTISTATEMYYSLKNVVGTGQGTLTITNNGDGILSMTKLMAVTTPSAPAGAPRRFLSVNESTLSNTMDLLEMQAADLTIDEETIETTSSDNGTVTITLQTSEDAQTVVVRDSEGNVVDPDSIDFTIDETGVKNWTIVLTEEQSGEFTYTLQAEYENGYAPEEPTTVTVSITLPEPEAEELTIDFGTSKFGRFFAKLIEFIRFIISLFR